MRLIVYIGPRPSIVAVSEYGAYEFARGVPRYIQYEIAEALIERADFESVLTDDPRYKELPSRVTEHSEGSPAETP